MDNKINGCKYCSNEFNYLNPETKENSDIEIALIGKLLRVRSTIEVEW